MSNSFYFLAAYNLNKCANISQPNLIGVWPLKQICCSLEYFEGLLKFVSLLQHTDVIQDQKRCCNFKINYMIVCSSSIIKLFTTLQKIDVKRPSSNIVGQILLSLLVTNCMSHNFNRWVYVIVADVHLSPCAIYMRKFFNWTELLLCSLKIHDIRIFNFIVLLIKLCKPNPQFR
jgi:hypothetical protein